MEMSVIYFTSLVILLTSASGQQAPTVDLGVGRIVGKVETILKDNVAHNVKEFLGIPFAKPPVGSLRFLRPEAVSSLDVSPYDASYYRAHCPQMSTSPYSGISTEDEDCLYLNVFIPESSPEQTSGYAVMIWIHGGGWVEGAADLYHAATIAATGNVIVVTVNYRLGILGFLSTGDEVASGNFGLYDQHMAIQWVHDNIYAFGGDTNRVTIFGESAGAYSVSLQSLYEKNHGLFQRVIAESGTATSFGLTLSKSTLPTAQFAAKQFNCSAENSFEMINCLKRVPWNDLKRKLIELGMDPANSGKLQFTPTMDGDFIKTDYTHLSKLLSKMVPNEVRFFRSLDFLTGINAYEGGLFLPFLHRDLENFRPTMADMESYMMVVNYMLYDRGLAQSVNSAIIHEYTNWTDPFSVDSVRLQYTKIYGDAYFAVAAVETAHIHAQDTEKGTYMYHFVPKTTVRPSWTPSWLPGADHYEEVRLVFGQGYSTMADWEKNLANTIMRYWTNFAKTGNPNSPVPPSEVWPVYNASHQFYMELDRDMSAHSSKQYLGARTTHFWLDVMPGLVGGNTDQNHPDGCTASGAETVMSGFRMILVIALMLCLNLK